MNIKISIKNILNQYTTMQGQLDSHIILLYSLKFTTKEDTTQAIIDALSPYSDSKITPDDITIQNKDGKCSAHVKLPEAAVVKVCQVDKLKVADSFVNKRRYYPDFQIFINKLNDKITHEEVKSYFEKFGEVDKVQITEGHGQLNDSKIVNRHCYIKFRNQQAVDKCLFYPKHQIPSQGQIDPAAEVKVVRTYKVGQNDDTDKRIFVKIIPQVINTEEFEDLLNNELSKFGKLRQRIKVESISGNAASKAIATFIKNESSQQALQKFDYKKFQKFVLQLRPFISKQAHKIFAKGLKPGVNQQQLEKVFQMFGKISEKTILTPRGSVLCNAIIAYEDENGFKRALIQYQEHPQVRDLFAEYPSVTIHMNPKDRKEMIQFNRKKSSNIKKVSPYNIGSMNMGMGNMNMGMANMNMGMGNLNMNMGNLNMNMGINMNQMGGFNNSFQPGSNYGGQIINPNNNSFNPPQQRKFNPGSNSGMVPPPNVGISRPPIQGSS